MVSSATRGHRWATMSVMSTSSPSVTFHLGHKGRVVLPAAVRRAAHVPDYAEVVAHAEGEGRIVLETTDAIRRRVWEAAATPPSEHDGGATEGIRAIRTEDNLISDQAHITRTNRSGSAESGTALLRHLGL